MLYLKHKEDKIFTINISEEELFKEVKTDLLHLLLKQNLNKTRTPYTYGIHKNFSQYIFESQIVNNLDIASIENNLDIYLNVQNPNGNANNNYKCEDIELLVFKYNDKLDKSVNHKTYICTQLAKHKTLAKTINIKKNEDGGFAPFTKTENSTIVIKDLFDEIIEVKENFNGTKEYSLLFYKPQKAGKFCKLTSIPEKFYKKDDFINEIQNNNNLLKYLDDTSLKNIKTHKNSDNLNIFVKFTEVQIIQAINMINKEAELEKYRKYVINNKLSLPENNKDFTDLLEKITKSIPILEKYSNTLEIQE